MSGLNIDKIKEMIDRAHNKISSLKDELGKKTTEMEELQKKVDGYLKENNELKTQNTKLEKRLIELDTELSENKRVNQQSVKEIEEQLSQLSVLFEDDLKEYSEEAPVVEKKEEVKEVKQEPKKEPELLPEEEPVIEEKAEKVEEPKKEDENILFSSENLEDDLHKLDDLINN